MIDGSINTAGEILHVIQIRVLNLSISPRGHGKLGRGIESINHGFNDKVDISLYLAVLEDSCLLYTSDAADEMD